MMSYFFNSEIGYYEGDRISPDDIEVPQRPDQWATWNGKKWVAGSPPVDSSDAVEQFKALLAKPEVKEFLKTLG